MTDLLGWTTCRFSSHRYEYSLSIAKPLVRQYILYVSTYWSSLGDSTSVLELCSMSRCHVSLLMDFLSCSHTACIIVIMQMISPPAPPNDAYGATT